MKDNTIAVVSGGFDPLHSGHISYFKSAKKLGYKLIVALNSDQWLIDKKGKYLMPFNERKIILENLNIVDEVIGFQDDKNGSCIDALEQIKKNYPNNVIVFCNGGDRNKKNIPEMSLEGIKFQFGVGGLKKINSSSSILKKYINTHEDRIWGKFYNLFTDKHIKLKELIVYPKKGMSFQRHFFRSEIWFVSKGKCLINFSNNKKSNTQEIILNQDEVFHVKKKQWHQITNPYNDPCHIIEIQYGTKLSEKDIERYRFYEN